MLSRILSVLIGYGFGCFLMAELIARRYTGKSASRLGETGNPGMANIMASLGFWPGIATLLGDMVKCLLAMTVCYLLFHKDGWIVTLYAGFGCTLGHDFPYWRRFRGGKGVATSSTVIVIYSFLWGVLANIAGMLVRMGEMTREEAKNSPAGNRLTAFVGMEEPATPETFIETVHPGDVILLCSDGLFGITPETEIIEILQSGKTPEEICKALIDAANAHGGRDNISAVYIRILPEQK